MSTPPRFSQDPEIVYLAPGTIEGAPGGRGFFVVEPQKAGVRFLAGPLPTEAAAVATLKGVLRGTVSIAPTLHEKAMASACPKHGASCRCVAHQQLLWTYQCGVRVHADSLPKKAA